MKGKRTKRHFLDFLACFLVIVTHFTNYITYLSYTRIYPDILLSFGFILVIALILTGLLQVPYKSFRTSIFSVLVFMFLSDAIFEFGTTEGGIRLNLVILATSVTFIAVFLLSEHVNKILTVVFAVMLVSTIVFNLPISQQEPSDNRAAVPIRDDLPVIIHLVLDEHTGISGMTPTLPGDSSIREEVEEFYLHNGFRIFSHAYSEYFDSHSSMARTLNADSDNSPLSMVSKHRNKYIVVINEYFEHRATEGYKINVLQSSYLKFCEGENITVNKCSTYRHDAFDEEAIKSLPLIERLMLISRMYYSSLTLLKLLKPTEVYLKHQFSLMGISLFDLNLWHGRVGPLATSAPLKRLIEKVSQSSGGEFFFAHLLTPHYPYVYDSTCKVRSPISSWKVRSQVDGTNSPDKRRVRYSKYFDQIRCTMRKLQPMFEAMKKKGTFENAVIIIHGDHGARITRINPVAQNAPQMTVDDYIDSFSTLFVLKAPGVTPGIDDRMHPLSQLLPYATNRQKTDILEFQEPSVYLSDGDEKYVKIPIPDFPFE